MSIRHVKYPSKSFNYNCQKIHGPSRDETLLEIRIISQCDHLLHQEKILGHQFLTGMSIPVKN